MAVWELLSTEGLNLACQPVQMVKPMLGEDVQDSLVIQPHSLP